MALRLICSSCSGQGYRKDFLVFKKTCERCGGTGRFVKKNFNVIESGKKLNKKDFVRGIAK